MSGTVGISPIRRIGSRSTWWHRTRRIVMAIGDRTRRIRAAGGLPTGVAVPLAVAITATVSWALVVAASAVRPT